MDYSENVERERKKFLKKISQFNIRWALEQSNNIENETQQIIKTLSLITAANGRVSKRSVQYFQTLLDPYFFKHSS